MKNICKKDTLYLAAFVLESVFALPEFAMFKVEF